MLLTIHLFARLRDEIGESQIRITVPEVCTASQLVDLLQTLYPQVSGLLTRCRLAINQDFAREDQLLQESDELALIPPVSGG
jgi:MoaE-MoaD fusion protein